MGSEDHSAIEGDVRCAAGGNPGRWLWPGTWGNKLARSSDTYASRQIGYADVGAFSVASGRGEKEGHLGSFWGQLGFRRVQVAGVFIHILLGQGQLTLY